MVVITIMIIVIKSNRVPKICKFFWTIKRNKFCVRGDLGGKILLSLIENHFHSHCHKRKSVFLSNLDTREEIIDIIGLLRDDPSSILLLSLPEEK